MQGIVLIYADKVPIKGGMVNFRQQDSILNHRLTEILVCVTDDMRCIQQA